MAACLPDDLHQASTIFYKYIFIMTGAAKWPAGSKTAATAGGGTSIVPRGWESLGPLVPRGSGPCKPDYSCSKARSRGTSRRALDHIELDGNGKPLFVVA